MKALVTGASSGIGREIAIYLSELGYDVILVGRNKDELKNTASMIKTNSKIIDMDLSIKDNVFKLYEDVKDDNIDFLVNNAGFGLFGNSWETDLDRELNMIDLNIRCVHILTKLFLSDMVKKDSGYILNVSSSAGFLIGPYLNTYYASKNYVTKYTMGIYEELRRSKSNVHISCLCPGPVDTNFNKVAGGHFNTSALSSRYVGRYAIDKCLKNKLVIVPGLKVKLGLFGSRFLPYKLLMKIIYYVQKNKDGVNNG